LIDRFINLIGINAKLLATALVVLIIANVCFQFYTHKTTTLTPWKGGGFGMYTEPHADGRTVWLEMQGASGVVQMRVYPENEIIRAWIDGVSLGGGKALSAISNQAAGLRHFPDDKKANALVQSAAHIGWLDQITGGIKPKEGATFKPEDIRVIVYENMQEMRAAKLKRRLVFSTSDGGA
jgi:hypothetical protein